MGLKASSAGPIRPYKSVTRCGFLDALRYWGGFPMVESTGHAGIESIESIDYKLFIEPYSALLGLLSYG